MGYQPLVLCGEFEDGGAGGAEGGHLLAGENIVRFPVTGEGKEGTYTSSFCA